jgi:transposase
MSEGACLVGLDVHQAQSLAAVLDPVTGELRVVRLRGAPGDVVPVLLEGFGRPVRAVYEAGSTGFGLARAATRRRLDVRVIARGSIPRAPGDRVKTDRRDAKRLVRLFAAGELSFSFVPSEEEEHFRDLVRCIDDARKDLMRSRHRLSKFLLRRGCASRAARGHSRISAGWARWRLMTRSPKRCSSTTAALSTRSCTAAVS